MRQASAKVIRKMFIEDSKQIRRNIKKKYTKLSKKNKTEFLKP